VTAPQGVLEKVSGQWKSLTRFAVGIVAVATSIFLPPPAYVSDSGTGTLVPFVRVAVTIATALMLVAMVRWKKTAHARYWVSTAAVLFLIVTASYLFYNDRRDHLTALGPDGARVVIGSRYTSTGAAYVAAHPETTAEQLLDDSPCETSPSSECNARQIWTAESISANKRLLSILFIAGALLLDAALLAAAQCALLEP
jgi:hypothetical protein